MTPTPINVYIPNVSFAIPPFVYRSTDFTLLFKLYMDPRDSRGAGTYLTKVYKMYTKMY